MNIEKIREEFEARHPLPSTCEGFNGGFYFVTDIYSGKEKRHPHHQKWLIWQASRESLVIELPELWRADERKLGDEGIVRNGTIIRCREAIEAAGLKVKP